MFAVLNLNKAKGQTSHDMVAEVRRIFGLRKVGHLGTLDPLATGVLPLCLGNATRLIEYFPDTKVYEAEMTLGQSSLTLDTEGELSFQEPCPKITQPQVEASLFAFRGKIAQRVPLFSAVHYKGKKLYHYARAGVQIPDEELPVKDVEIFELDLLSFQAGDFPKARLKIHCSSGTYIRSLIRDIAKNLGTQGLMSQLVRTHHGRFSLETAVDLDTLKHCKNPSQYLQEPLQYLDFPRLDLQSEERFKALCHGMKVDCLENDPKIRGNSLVLGFYAQNFAGVLQKDGTRYKPIKIFSSQN